MSLEKAEKFDKEVVTHFNQVRSRNRCPRQASTFGVTKEKKIETKNASHKRI